MFIKLVSLFFVSLFVFVSPAFGQSQKHGMLLALRWPEQTSEDIRVTVLPEGGNCPEVLEGTAEESLALAGDYGGLSWYNHTVQTTQIVVGDYFTACTYQVLGGKMHYVLTSMVLDQEYTTPFEYTPVVPQPEPPSAPKPSPKPLQWEYGAVMPGYPLLFDITNRLRSTGGLMIEPAWLRVHEDVALTVPLYISGSYDAAAQGVTPSLAAGLAAGVHLVHPSEDVVLDAQVAVMTGYGSYIGHCTPRNQVSQLADLYLECGSQGTMTVRWDGWWFGPAFKVGVDFPIRGHVRLGVGAWWLIQLYDQNWPMFRELMMTAELNGQVERVPYAFDSQVWYFRAPIMPGVYLKF